MRQILCLVLCCLVVSAEDYPIQYTIVHVNDLFSAFAGVTSDGQPCDRNTHPNDCIGGAHRIAAQIRDMRRKEPILFVNAGNNLGGFWYKEFGSGVVSDLLKQLDFDVINLGSSDYDLDSGPDDFSQFLTNMVQNSRLISCNVETSYINGFYSSVRKSTQLTLGFKKRVGVIGFVGHAIDRGRTDGLTINDPIKCIQEESEKLRKDGVDVILAIGSGNDEILKEVANNAYNVDVVIGSYGSSKNLSLLRQRKAETYPDYIKQEDGKQTIVATADIFGQSLGILTLNADSRGNIITSNGKLIRLDSRVESDNTTHEKVEEYLNKLVVGSTNVYLDGRQCATRECNIGNLIADALVFHRIHYINQTFVKAMAEKSGNRVFGQKIDDKRDVIALINSELIGDSVGLVSERVGTDRQYFITKISLNKAFKIGNPKIQMFVLNGKTIRQILEDHIRRRDLVQVSGIRVNYDLSKPINSQVIGISVKSGNNSDPQWTQLEDSKLYDVLMPQNIVIEDSDQALNVVQDLSAADILQHYIKHNSPINTRVEERIRFENENGINDSFGTSAGILTTLLSTLIAVCHLRRYN